MSKLRMSLACWNYDRTRALMDGSVQPDGIELNYLNMPVEETFFRMLRHREFDCRRDVAVVVLGVAVPKPDRPFVAIPVYPSRYFRHSCIYVNADAGIREPKDLIGKRVGNPEYQMTAPVWIRGILADHHGVPVDSVTYVTGGEEEPGRSEKIKLDLPPRIRVEPIGPAQTLSQMLASGEIDALLYRAHAVVVHRPRRARQTPVREPRRRRAPILSQHRHLPDHARGGHPA